MEEQMQRGEAEMAGWRGRWMMELKEAHVEVSAGVGVLVC